MTDIPDAASISVSVEKIEAYGISNDGSMVMFKFLDPDGDPVAVTMPVGLLGALQTTVLDAKRDAEKRSLKTGQLRLNMAQSFSVGTTNAFPNHVAIGFDGGLASEQIWMVGKSTALALSDGIAKELLKPPPSKKPKLILPAGFKQ